jgi:hypothetical protein
MEDNSTEIFVKVLNQIIFFMIRSPILLVVTKGYKLKKNIQCQKKVKGIISLKRYTENY